MVSIKEAIRQRRFKSNRQKAIINLLYTSSWLKDMQKQLFKPSGITGQQYNVLRILKGRYPNAASAGEVKAVMIDKSPDLTRLIDRLVEKGFVERSLNAGNRRKVDIRITQQGLSVIDHIEPHLVVNREFASNLTEEEAGLMSDLLDKLRG